MTQRRTLMRDHAYTKWPKNNSRFGPWMIVGLLFAIGFISMVSRSSRADQPKQNGIVVNYNLRDLPMTKADRRSVSPEMRSYSKRVSHVRVTDLEAVE